MFCLIQIVSNENKPEGWIIGESIDEVLARLAASMPRGGDRIEHII